MNKRVVDGWQKDFSTGLPQVPQGWFSDFSDLKNSKQPLRIRALPVLRGVLDPRKFDFSKSQPNSAGIGRTLVGEVACLAIHFQLGASAFFWLLNPADPAVWTALDAWAAAGTMVIAPEFPNGSTAVVAAPFAMPSGISVLRAFVAAESEFTAKFQAAILQLMRSGRTKDVVSSQIPSVRALRHAEACMVRTEITRPLVLMEGSVAPDGNDPIAHALDEIRQQLISPQSPRH